MSGSKLSAYANLQRQLNMSDDSWSPIERTPLEGTGFRDMKRFRNAVSQASNATADAGVQCFRMVVNSPTAEGLKTLRERVSKSFFDVYEEGVSARAAASEMVSFQMQANDSIKAMDDFRSAIGDSPDEEDKVVLDLLDKYQERIESGRDFCASASPLFEASRRIFGTPETKSELMGYVSDFFFDGDILKEDVSFKPRYKNEFYSGGPISVMGLNLTTTSERGGKLCQAIDKAIERDSTFDEFFELEDVVGKVVEREKSAERSQSRDLTPVGGPGGPSSGSDGLSFGPF